MSRQYNTPLGSLPSVTTILNIVMKNLVEWAANLQWVADIDKAWDAIKGSMFFESKEHFESYMREVYGAHKNKSKEAMGLGSLVHSMADCWNQGMFDGEWPDYCNFLSDYYSKEAVQMLGGYFACLNRNKIKILKSEMTVYHPDGYAGTLDAIVKFDDAIMVMDIKTGGVYWQYWLQLEAYRRAYSWMKKEEPVGRIIIRLDKDRPGEWELLCRPLEINTQIRVWMDRRKKKQEYIREIQHFPCDHELDYQAFLSAKTLFERSKHK